MRFQLSDLITRAEPAIQPAMTLYLVLVTAGALSICAAVVGSAMGAF
jgi:hypothetical protein